MEDTLELRRELIFPACISQLDIHSRVLVDDRQVFLGVVDRVAPLEVGLSLAVECAEANVEACPIV